MNGALLSLILTVIGGALLAIQAPTNAVRHIERVRNVGPGRDKWRHE